MRFYLLLVIVSFPLLAMCQDQKFDHMEVTIRGGAVQGGAFYYPNNSTYIGFDFFKKPYGQAVIPNAFSGELSINWIKKSFEKNTRWAFGLKLGAMPSKLNYFYNNSFYNSDPPLQPSLFTRFDEELKLNLGTHYYGGITGGFRTRIFKIKKMWMDWNIDVGLTYAVRQNVSISFQNLFEIEGNINGSEGNSGKVFLDLRHGIKFNFPVKGRIIGVGGSVTAAKHRPFDYQITYFGFDETITEQTNIRLTFPAIDVTYHLMKSN